MTAWNYFSDFKKIKIRNAAYFISRQFSDPMYEHSAKYQVVMN